MPFRARLNAVPPRTKSVSPSPSTTSDRSFRDRFKAKFTRRTKSVSPSPSAIGKRKLAQPTAQAAAPSKARNDRQESNNSTNVEQPVAPSKANDDQQKSKDCTQVDQAAAPSDQQESKDGTQADQATAPSKANDDQQKSKDHTQVDQAVQIAVQTPQTSKSLWQQAYEKLEADLPKVPRAYENALLKQSGPASSALKDLNLLEGEERQKRIAQILVDQEDLVKEAKWKIQPFGKEVVVKDVVQKIAAAVLYAKDFVTAAVSPEPHAALAWAGISVLLPILTNLAEQDDAAIKGLDYIQVILLRYRRIESIDLSDTHSQLDEDADVASRLRSQTIRIYCLALQFQMRLATQHARSSMRQTLMDIGCSNDWKAILKELEASEREGQNMIETLGHSRIAKIEDLGRVHAKQLAAVAHNQLEQLVKIDELMRRAKEEHEVSLRQETKEEAQARRDVLSAFGSPLDYKRDKNRNLDRDGNVARATGTGKWFLGSSLFADFRNRDESRLLFVTAEPGMGKSTLVAAILEEVLRPSKARVVSYFFFKDESPEQRSAFEALSAIIHQILLQRPILISTCVLRCIGDYHLDLKNVRHHMRDLWDILVALSKEYGGTIYCVLDALDECDNADRNELMNLLNAYFRKPEPSTKLKFLITGRPYFDQKYKFQDLIGGLHYHDHAHLAGENAPLEDDIPRVIDAKVQSLEALDTKTKRLLRDRLRNLNLHTKSFLWLKLILEELRCHTRLQGAGPKMIERLLTHALPESVDSAYEDMLARSTDPVRGREILQILVVAVRPLTLAELRVLDGLLQEPSAQSYRDLELQDDADFLQTISSVCGHFVYFSEGVVHWLHQTAREFLMKTNQTDASGGHQPWQGSIQEGEAHGVMFTLCSTLLEFSEFKDDMRLLATANHSYKTRYDVFSCPQTPFEHHLALSVSQHESKYPFVTYASCHWREHYSLSRDGAGHLRTQHGRRVCDLSSKVFWNWFIVALSETPDVHSPAMLFTSIMDCKNFEVSPELPDWYPAGYLDLEGKPHRSQVPPHPSSFSLSLEWHASDTLDALDELTLQWCASCDHLQTPYAYTDVYTNSSTYLVAEQEITVQPGSPLSVVRAVRLADNGQEAALHSVLSYHSTETVVDAIVAGGSPATLRKALRTTQGRQWLESDCDKVVKFMSRGSISVTTAILESIDDASKRRTMAQKAWARGAYQFHAEIPLLLDNGVSVHDEVNLGGEQAIHCVHDEVLKTLLDHGADASRLNAKGQTPLMMSCEGRRRESACAQLLLNACSCVNVADNEGQTALMLAGRWRNHSIVALLLQHGADVDAKDKRGYTALMHTVCGQSCFGVSQDRYVPAVGINGDDNKRRHSCIHKLLEVGATPDEKAPYGAAALPILLALRSGVGSAVISRIISRVVTAGESLDVYDGSCETPLMIAVGNDDLQTASLLLAAGARVDAAQSGEHGAMAIHHALCFQLQVWNSLEYPWSQRGSSRCTEAFKALPLRTSTPVSILELLLNSGANLNVDAADRSAVLQCTPIDLAALSNNYEAAEFLLSKGANTHRSRATYDHKQSQALIWATRHRNKQLVKLLLHQRGETTWRDVWGLTALMWAVILNDYAIAKLLLENGADPNDGNVNEINRAAGVSVSTPLFFALFVDSEDLVDLLISHKANVNALLVSDLDYKRRIRRFRDSSNAQEESSKYKRSILEIESSSETTTTTVLSYASASMKKKLLELGADPDLEDKLLN